MSDLVVKRDNLFRGLPGGLELREDDAAPLRQVMTGHFAVFDVFTEISSWFEGDFMERVSPGAFTKTIKENVSNMRVQFDHGYDRYVGSAPLGPIDVIEEDEIGARYEVPLIDTDYNRDRILPLLEGRLMGSGEATGSLLGASFRFQVTKDEWDEEPELSEENPKGMPERTIKEVRLHEFGPVVFGAYPEATSGMRSLTDHYLDQMRSRSHPAGSTTGEREQAGEPPQALDDARNSSNLAAAQATLLRLKGAKS